LRTLGYKLACILCLAAMAPQAMGMVLCVGADGHAVYGPPRWEGGCVGDSDSHAPSEGPACSVAHGIPSSCTNFALSEAHSAGGKVVLAESGAGLGGLVVTVPPVVSDASRYADAADEAAALSHLAAISVVVLLI